MPIVTNSGVEFTVNHERIKMRPGDLWCLDTSYLHSVENNGTESRVHIVIECKINEKLRSQLPNDLRSKIHSAAFSGILAWSLGRALIVNSIKDPKYLKAQLGMIWHFIGWRFLGKHKPS